MIFNVGAKGLHGSRRAARAAALTYSIIIEAELVVPMSGEQAMRCHITLTVKPALQRFLE